MAMIYHALEIQRGGAPTGRWHYVAASDEERHTIYPVCGCEPGSEGHSSPEAAQRHYHETESQRVKLFTDEATQLRCASPGCGAWTTGRADVGQHFPASFALCDEHRAEGVATILYLAKVESPSAGQEPA